MDLLEREKLLKEAERLVQQGSLSQAVICYKKIDPSQSDSVITERLQACYQRQLRKLWRQGRTEEFGKMMRELGYESALGLALARLQGPEALERHALGESPTAPLAKCALQMDVKAALLTLRQSHTHKQLAEGWLSLLKGDADRAFNAFEQAKDIAVAESKIGQALVYLSTAKYEAAVSLLDKLKPVATRRFPVLTKTMGWEDSNSESLNTLHHYLFSASLEELQKIEKSLPATQKPMRGWVWLRIGDYLWQDKSQHRQAGRAWEKASTENKELELDALKRLFIASHESRQIQVDPNEAFIKFYRCLLKKAPTQANDFLEYLVFHSSAKNFLNKNTLRKKEKWLFSPPLPAMQLLWLQIVHQDCICELVNAYFLPDTPKNLLELGWEDFAPIFTLLDPFYSSQDAYLQYKQDVAKLFQENSTYSQTLLKRLQLNPALKELLLPEYLKLAFKVAFSGDGREAALAEEVRLLCAIFPSDFDLIRLSIVTNYPRTLWHEQAQAFATRLSQGLYAILCLQLAIDQGWGLARCQKLIPPNTTLQSDCEADCRLFSALCTERLNYPKGKIQRLFSLLAADEERKHTILSHLWQYELVTPPPSLLKKWSNSCTTWHPQYHLAMYYLYKNNFTVCLKIFLRIYQKIPNTAPEYHRVGATKKICSPNTSLFELFSMLDPKMHAAFFEEFS